MLKETGRVILREAPFTRKGNNGQDFTLCKYWVVIDGQMFSIYGRPDHAKEGDVVALTLKASDKGSPLVVFAKPL